MPKIVKLIRFFIYFSFFWFTSQGQSKSVNFTILHFSDGESTLENFPTFHAILNDQKQKHPKNILISSGDLFLPGPFFMAGSMGKADIELMNLIGLEVSCLGNHEFDYGPSQLASLVKKAKFPYLSLNIDPSADKYLSRYYLAKPPLEFDKAKGKITKSIILQKLGVKFGFIGIITPTLADISSPGKKLRILANEHKLVNKEAAELKKKGAEIIILLSHLQGIGNEIDLVSKLSDVHIVIGGGGNDRFANKINDLWPGDTAQGAYPTIINDKDDSPVLVLSTDGDYKYLGVLPLSWDSKEKFLKIRPGAGPVPTYEKYVKDLGLKIDKTVLNKVNDLKNIIEKKGNSVWGKSQEFLNGIRHDVRNIETNLGNLTADSSLWYAKKIFPKTNIAWKNSGSIRSSLGKIDQVSGQRLPLKDGISQLDIESCLRFNDELVVLELSLKQLKIALESGIRSAWKTSGGFPQVGGMRFTFNSKLKAQQLSKDKIEFNGERVRSIDLLKDKGGFETVFKNGKFVVDSKRKVYMVTSGFVAKGGDKNLIFKKLKIVKHLSEKKMPSANFKTPGHEQNSLALYLKEIKIVPKSNKKEFRILDLAFQRLP